MSKTILIGINFYQRFMRSTDEKIYKLPSPGAVCPPRCQQGTYSWYGPCVQRQASERFSLLQRGTEPTQVKGICLPNPWKRKSKCRCISKWLNNRGLTAAFFYFLSAVIPLCDNLMISMTKCAVERGWISNPLPFFYFTQVRFVRLQYFFMNFVYA